MSRISPAPDDSRIDLAYALGFPNYPTNPTAEPYLNYITNRYIGRGTVEGYLKLVVHVVQHFQVVDNDKSLPVKSIQSLLDRLCTSTNEYFVDTNAGSQTRRDDVEDTVMYIIGVWTLLLSSFVHLPFAGGARKIALAYSIRAQETSAAPPCHPYEESVSGLIKGSGLLPGPGQWALPESNDKGADLQTAIQLMAMLKKAPTSSVVSAPSLISSASSLHKLDSSGYNDTRMSLRFLDDLDSVESLHVAATHLNAHTLGVFGAVDVVWTHNVSRHMLLCKRGGRHVMELFALPSALSASTLTSDTVGITSEYAQEVTESYSILFNARSELPRHAKLGKYFGFGRFCWCWPCSSLRYRHRAIAAYRKHSEKKTRGAKRNQTSHASEFDPMLIELVENEPSDWTPELFPSLWSRIVVLEEHLLSAKPWNIWILFRDKRDTLQFWTFLFATIVVMLTFVQIILGVAQVVGSFE
ncbi:hypothetical protein CC86DRAFT_456116 [Ophiobolus disseminans]|uniref:Uncharacterized protein n=1 Tax=Ophiobolus disseminans TaxID=1469910 RepID=A0A6A6ZXW5_9PLEO|nr:hypothetical protein CC86DRAFT_456116 [Ophiobolus disseminans]